MLKNMLKNKIENYIGKLNISKYIDLDDCFGVEFLAQGEYNINFILKDKVNKYVFRINTKSQLDLKNQIEYEYNAIKRLEESGVTPKVYYVDNSKKYIEYGILIMEYLEGEPLDYKKDLKKAANIFSNIHSIEIKEVDLKNFIVEKNIFTDRIEESKRLLKEFWNSRYIDIKIKLFFEKFLNWCDENKFKEEYFKNNPWKVINNTEVNSHNFIIGKNDYYLIDWEKPVISDPCQDLTQFLAPTTTLWKSNFILNSNEINEFFNHYEKRFKNKDIRERVDMYKPYLYLRALSWCAYAYIEYQNPNKDIKNMDTYNKIKEYLDENFMEKLLKRWI
ncbi:phosphotransferase [Clostridium oceanicum]|uniref:Aminoglycoside phosphotransferase family protein n=1 Tax=Clostridium oceanicum TaxID=1543 RepID=A0ABP3V447_9CLOT